MPKIALTDVTVRNLKPIGAQTDFFDLTLSSFGIRVGRRTRAWIVMQGKPRVRHIIGKYPALSLKDARKQALARLHGGIPTPPPKTPPLASEAVQTFLDTHPLKVRTHKEYGRLLNRHFLPILGPLPLPAITTSDITPITDRLAATPAERIHIHAAMRTFFAWATRRQLISANPMQHLPLPARPNKRERVLTDNELHRVYRAAQHMAYPFGFIVLICIHTGMRRSEAASLKWTYITPDYITLPPEITKNNTTSVLPNLIGDALALIPRTSEYLFPSSVDTIFSAWSKSKRQLDVLADVRNYVLHDLRRTFSTIHARIGTPPHVTEALLNHKTGVRSPLQRIYDRHSYEPEMRAALTNYERFLRQLLGTPQSH